MTRRTLTPPPLRAAPGPVGGPARRARAWAGLVALVALVASPAAAQTARLTVLPDSVAIGEPFGVAVTVTHAPGRSVFFPEAPPALPEVAPGLTLGDAEVLAVRRFPPASRGRVRTDSAVVTVAVFVVDSARVGPVPVHLSAGPDTVRVEAPAQFVPVRSVLGGEPEPEAAPLGGPAQFPSPVPVLTALGVLGAALVAAFVWALVRLLRKPAPVAPRPAPYPEALARLDALAAETPTTADAVEAHFEAVRDVLRTYLVRRLDVPARELTTSELASRLDADDRVPDAGRRAVRGVLRLSDLVAFAALRPASEVAADARAKAREAVEAIEGGLRERQAEPEPTALPSPARQAADEPSTLR